MGKSTKSDKSVQRGGVEVIDGAVARFDELLPPNVRSLIRGLKLDPEFMSNTNELALILSMLIERINKMEQGESHEKVLQAEIQRARTAKRDCISLVRLQEIVDLGHSRRQHQMDAQFLIKMANELRLGEVTITKTMREMMAAEEVNGMVEALVAIVQDELAGEEFDEVRGRIAVRFENLCDS